MTEPTKFPWRWLALLALLFLFSFGGIVIVAIWRRMSSPEPKPSEVEVQVELTPLPWPGRIDEYNFQSESLRTFAAACDALARRQYRDLQHDNYDDPKRDVMPQAIVARWYVGDENGIPLPTTSAAEPARAASIHLIRRDEIVQEIVLIGSAHTSAQWSSSVQYNPARHSAFHINLFHESLALDSGVRRINLNAPSITLGTTKTQTRLQTVELSCSLPPNDETEWNRGTIAPFFESAEAMRDEALRRLEQLEQEAKRRIEAGDGFTTTDWSQVRSDNPPRSMSRELGPLHDDERRLCLKQLEEGLSHKRQTVQTHYQDIYAAVRDAFPFFELVPQELP